MIQTTDMLTFCRCLLTVACLLSVPLSADAKRPISYRAALDLSPAERQMLDLKARQGDESAAFRLAAYYSSIVNDLRRREYYLVLAAKSGSFESIEALADFYAMPGGAFNFAKAVSLRKKLKEKFAERTDNIAWAEACAYDYHWRSPWINSKKEGMFRDLARSWRTGAR